MGLIADLLRRKSVPPDKVDASLQWLDKAKATRGEETGRYLALMVDRRQIPPPNAPSTLEDLDQRAATPNQTYSPPVETLLSGLDEEQGVTNPIEDGINLFFDNFVGLASAHNEKASAEQQIGIQRPVLLEEKFPEPNGKPVMTACAHTGEWGIYFFAYGDTVDVYLLPYDEGHPLAFKTVHTDSCEPHLRLTTRQGAAGLEWYVKDKRFTREHIPDLAQHLLNDLVSSTHQ